jgi:hypothetical protein
MILSIVLSLAIQVLPPDSTVQRIVKERLGPTPFQGIVVGLVDADGSRRVVAAFIQATGQPKFPIFAESETEFFLKGVDAQITFAKDQLILHQNGQNLPGKKIR